MENDRVTLDELIEMIEGLPALAEKVLTDDFKEADLRLLFEYVSIVWNTKAGSAAQIGDGKMSWTR